MLLGILVSLCFWTRLAKRDSRLMFIYAAALVGAFTGAKLIYIFAEGWRDFQSNEMWLRLATGKSILGALLGGYAAVEMAKKAFGYKGVTGDWFATIVPLSIMVGRIGCMVHGCCLGRLCEASWLTSQGLDGLPRWPAAAVEFIFNAVMIGTLFLLRRAGLMKGQHFHIYLITYGVFRFFHEFARETPVLWGGISGYQLAAIAVTGLGLVGFLKRRQALATVQASV
jgi:phosphatidylglycerol---prolipoprotein diacylglyceryl transferase